MTYPPTSNSPTAVSLHNRIWSALHKLAHEAGLDPSLFAEPHRTVVDRVVAFLRHVQEPAADDAPGRSWFRLLAKRPSSPESPAPVQPLIICGIPGTGKTTFLFLLDRALRETVGLPDNILPQMEKVDREPLAVLKRGFNGRLTSLLSVRAWTDLLYYYAWDPTQHKLVPQDRNRFIEKTLAPMKVVFADEVEMVGYSPTLPILARHGLLVIGSSNESTFHQLDSEELPAQIVSFDGVDMRVGNPQDAVVTADQAAWWELFERGRAAEENGRFEQLPYRRVETAVWLDFEIAMRAPLLVSEWAHFLQEMAVDGSPPTLLLDQFTLAKLRTNYDAVIRFVNLFDAVEQVGAGVLVRHASENPQLSREDITYMKAAIHNAIGVDADIKRRALAGVDRCTSRIGQAAFRAREGEKAEG